MNILEVIDLKTWFPIKRGILSKTTGHIRAVDGVNLKIKKGEVLGLVGESGCGKTTLGRTLLGLENAREGKALFFGKDLFAMTRHEKKKIKKRLQIIFQDPLSSLNPGMNIIDIITEGLVQFDLVEKDKTSHAIKLLHEVGLDKNALYRYPHEFSGGQRQRINIARAVSLRPDFIVCDEPVSALDVSVQAQIINLFLDLKEKYSLSYLFISHDLSVVSSIANKVAVMYLGKIVEYGPVEDVISSPGHPYTKALIDAVPVPGIHKKRKKILRGEAPSPSAPPSGCRFHTRCPEAKKICKEQEPAEVISGERRVWCHLYKG